MKARLMYIFIFLFLFYFSNLERICAGERYEFYSGIRQLGMGGAVVATVNDETALISNPAGLGKLRSKYITLIDPEIHLNSNITRFATASNLTGTLTIQDLITTLTSHPEVPYHARMSIFPSMVFPNFGIGLLGNYVYNAEVDATATDFYLNYRNDFALIVGYNFRLLDGIVKIGFNGKYINRVEADVTIPVTTTGVTINNIASEGNGIASDVGIIITAPWKMLPTIAGVVRDVGHTTFNAGGGMFVDTDNRPQTVRQTYDAGFSLSPILGNHTRLQITGEYRDIQNIAQETDIYRRIHGGIEFNWNDMFFLRGGMNQKYWTAGFEIAMQRFQLQLASYGEDIGTDGVNNREDRRYVAKFALRF